MLELVDSYALRAMIALPMFGAVFVALVGGTVQGNWRGSTQAASPSPQPS